MKLDFASFRRRLSNLQFELVSLAVPLSLLPELIPLFDDSLRLCCSINFSSVDCVLLSAEICAVMCVMDDGWEFSAVNFAIDQHTMKVEDLEHSTRFQTGRIWKLAVCRSCGCLRKTSRTGWKNLEGGWEKEKE